MARYSELSSAELVRACAGSKDERAWTEFIRRFRVVIAAAALRTARKWGEPSHHQLDDLIQDTYLKLCENDCRLLRSFQPRHEDSVFGFLKVVTANVVRDSFKSARAAKRGAGQTETIVEAVHADPQIARVDSFETLNQRLRLERVEKILIRVTAGKDQERKRIIFWLRHRQGFTASEIAAIPSIGLTTEGVESVLMRLAILIRGQILSETPHREVKVLRKQNRSNRLGS
ncbi:MAG: sigma-70 family RNA polymerase sigma factor [Terriglobales bacterium]